MGSILDTSACIFYNWVCV